MKSKIFSALLALSLSATALLTGCSKGEEAPKDKDTFTVGICQLVQHEALDAATEGFMKALTDEFGDKVSFENKNASGEAANCTSIIAGFVSKKVDLILANATAPLTAAASATSDIPVLGTSITNYGTALEIEDWSSKNNIIGTNVSGTSDLSPLDQQAKMIKDWCPNAKNVGLLFCNAEANSRYQVDVITDELKKLGLNVTEFSFTDTNDVSSVTKAACDASDVIYIPTDNMAASNSEAIANVVLAEKVPVITGEVGVCRGCGVATLSIDYNQLGYATGLMAAKILRGEAKVSEMPVEYDPNPKLFFNPEICKTLGITPLEGYTAID